MNRRKFMKIGLGAAAMAGLPLKMGEARTGVIVHRHVVKAFRRISLLAPQFKSLTGDSRDKVYQLYAGLLGIKNPPFHRVAALTRQVEVKGIENVVKWFMRQPEFRSLTPIGADKIVYPKKSKKDERFINVALLRAAQIQRCYLTIARRLPTHSELSETLVYLARTNARRPRHVAVNYPKIEMNHAYAQGGNPDGFSNPEGAALGGAQAAQVMSELSAQGLTEAEAAAAITAIGAALALTETGAAVATAGIGLISAARAAGVIGLTFTSTVFAISPTTVALTSGLAGTALTFTGIGMIGLGILTLVIVVPKIPNALSATPRGVEDSPPTNGNPPSAPPTTAPPEAVDNPPTYHIDITNTPPTASIIGVPDLTEDEAATAAAIDESEGNGTGSVGDDSDGDDGDGGGAASDGGASGSDGGGSGGGDGCKLIPIVAAAAGRKLMEEKNNATVEMGSDHTRTSRSE
jgi:hypothetical protein